MSRRPGESFWTKIFYGSGSLAFGVKDNGFNVLLLLFYNQVLGLPAGVAGGVLALALVVDSVMDPLIGYVSDHTRSRWGRRHPYMVAAALPASLSYLLLWMPPKLSQVQLALYLFGATVFVRSFVSLYEVPSSALGPELSTDYDQRTSYMGFRYLFGWIGGVTMYILAFALFLRPDQSHPVGQLNPAGYRNYGLAAAGVMFVSILVSTWGTRSAIPYLRKAPAQTPVKPREIAREIVGVLSNPSAAALLASGVVGNVAAGITFALQTYFTTFLWSLQSQSIALLGVGSYVSAAGAMAVAPWISKRLGKKWALISVACVSTITNTVALLLRLLGWFPTNNSSLLIPLLFLFSVVTAGLGIVPFILGASMMSDVVEDNQVRSGERSEGVLFAANLFLLKCVSGLGLLGGSLLLSFAKFPENAKPGHVPLATLNHLVLAYAGVVTTLNVVSILFVTQYRISREQHAANLESLSPIAAEMILEQPRLHLPGPP